MYIRFSSSKEIKAIKEVVKASIEAASVTGLRSSRLLSKEN